MLFQSSFPFRFEIMIDWTNFMGRTPLTASFSPPSIPLPFSRHIITRLYIPHLFFLFKNQIREVKLGERETERETDRERERERQTDRQTQFKSG